MLFTRTGELTSCFTYLFFRINAPMEEQSPELHRLRDVHQFPVCCTGPCSRLLVTVASLPRQPSIPTLSQFCCNSQKMSANFSGHSNADKVVDESSHSFRDLKHREHASHKSLKNKRESAQEDFSSLPSLQGNVKDSRASQQGKINSKLPQETFVTDSCRSLQTKVQTHPESDHSLYLLKDMKGKSESGQKEISAVIGSELFLTSKDFDTAALDEVSSIASSLDSHSTLSSFDDSLSAGRESGPEATSCIDGRVASELSPGYEHKQSWELGQQKSVLSRSHEASLANRSSAGASSKSAKKGDDGNMKMHVLHQENSSHTGTKGKNFYGSNVQKAEDLNQGKLYDKGNRLRTSPKRNMCREECSQSDHYENAEEIRKLKARLTKKDGEKDMRIEQRKDVHEEMGEIRSGQNEQSSLASGQSVFMSSAPEEWQKQEQNGQQNSQAHRKRQRKQRQQQLKRQKQKQQQEQFRLLREQQQQQQQQQQKDRNQGKQPQTLRVISSNVLSSDSLLAGESQEKNGCHKEINAAAATAISHVKTENQVSRNAKNKRKNISVKEKSVEQQRIQAQQDVSEEDFIRRLSDRLSAVQGPSQTWKCEYAQELKDEMISKEAAIMRRFKKGVVTEKTVGQEWSSDKLRSHKIQRKEKRLVNDSYDKMSNQTLGLDGSLTSQASEGAMDVLKTKKEEDSKRETERRSGKKSLRDLVINIEQNKKQEEPRKLLLSKETSHFSKGGNRVSMPSALADQPLVNNFQKLSIDVDNAVFQRDMRNSLEAVSSLARSGQGPHSSSSSSSDTTPVASPRPNSAQSDDQTEWDKPETAKAKTSSKSLVKVVGQKLARKALSTQNVKIPESNFPKALSRSSWSPEKSLKDAGDQTQPADLQNSLESFLGHIKSKSSGEQLEASKDTSLSHLAQLTTVECINSCLPSSLAPSATQNITGSTDTRKCKKITICSTTAQNQVISTSVLQAKSDIPVHNMQTNSRRIFQENLLPIMSYDAASESFKSVGGDWPAWQQDSGNYIDVACPHHDHLLQGGRKNGHPSHPSQPVLHSPKVLFSSDLPCMGFDMDGSVELMAQILLPSDGDGSSVVKWERGEIEDKSHQSLEGSENNIVGTKGSPKSPTGPRGKGDMKNYLNPPEMTVLATGRHVARRQLDYGQVQLDLQGSRNDQKDRQEYDLSVKNNGSEGDVESCATSSAIDIIAQRQKVVKDLSVPSLSNDRTSQRSALNTDSLEGIKCVEVRASSSNKLDLKSHPQLPSKLSPQLAGPLSFSSSSPSSSRSSSSSSSSSSSVRLAANLSSPSCQQALVKSSSSMLVSLLSSQDSSMTETVKASSPSLSLSTASAASSLPSPPASAVINSTATLIPEHCSSTATSHKQVSQTRETVSSSACANSSSLTQGSKPASLSISGEQNHTIQQPSLLHPLSQCVESVAKEKSQGVKTSPTLHLPSRPQSQSYAFLHGEVIPFTACQNGHSPSLADQNLPEISGGTTSTSETVSTGFPSGHFKDSTCSPSPLSNEDSKDIQNRAQTFCVNSKNKDICGPEPFASQDTVQIQDTSYEQYRTPFGARDYECENSALNLVQNGSASGKKSNCDKNKGGKDRNEDAGDVVFYLSETGDDISPDSQISCEALNQSKSSNISSPSSPLYSNTNPKESDIPVPYNTKSSGCNVQSNFLSDVPTQDQRLDNPNGSPQGLWDQSRSQSVSGSLASSTSSLSLEESQRKRQERVEDSSNLLESLSCGIDKVKTGCNVRENAGWSSVPPHRTVSTPSRLDSGAEGMPGIGHTSSTGRLDPAHPSMQQQAAGLRRLAMRSSSMVFNNRTGLPTQSSPAPLKRKPSGRFDYDASIVGTRSIQSALSCSGLASNKDSTSRAELNQAKGLSTSAPASSNCLLGNFEESLLNGRISPAGVVDGFTCELGASGSFCPSHLRLPVTAFFFSSLSEDNAPSPYLGHINLETVSKRGYHIPKQGTVQVVS